MFQPMVEELLSIETILSLNFKNKSKLNFIKEFDSAQPLMNKIPWRQFGKVVTWGTRDVEFWVIFFIENSTKLLKMVLKGKIS
jgi:hypothetical protein